MAGFDDEAFDDDDVGEIDETDETYEVEEATYHFEELSPESNLSALNDETVKVNLRGKVFQYRSITAHSERRPPQSATYLLLLVPLKYREHLLGDLEEEYRTILLPEFGLRKAQFYYWWHVILTCGSCMFNAVASIAKAMIRN